MANFPTSFDKEDLLKCARGELFGPGNAQLPEPPMLMMDRIAEISQDGRDELGVKGDNIDRLLLERNLDLINQVRVSRRKCL